MYPGDILKQTERMLENIDTLLQEAGSGLQDIMQAIVYLRDPADYVVVKQYIESRYPSFLQPVIVPCSVCQSGLLIETECIACHTGGCTSICILIIIYYTNDKKYGKHEERKIQGNKQDE
mgnify:CR=1 FL=1